MKRLLVMAVLLLAPATAQGDDGGMLLHQDAGPFTVTLFAAPMPLHVGAADFSVMVQDRGSGDVLFDPEIDLTFDGEPPVRLAAGYSSNRLLQAARVILPRAGLGKLVITIRRGGDRAQLTTQVDVKAVPSRAGLLWFYCLLPVVVILVFIVHQSLTMRSKPRA